MKRTGRTPFQGLQVGVIMLFAFTLLLWATFQSGQFTFAKQEKITLGFPSVGGLEEGAAVRLNGVPVGVVREIALRPGTNVVEVTLGVKGGTRARLHEGANARITTVGFLAELYVALDSGDDTRPTITNDEAIAVSAAEDPQIVMGKVRTVADSLEVLLGSLNEAGRGLARGEGTLGRLSRDDRLYEQFVTLSREATTLATRMNETQERVSDRLVSLAQSLDSLSWRMQHGDGTMAKLMTSTELHDRLTSSTARVDSVLTLVESGRGSLGRFLADSTLYDDTKALMGSMKRLMAEIEKNPKRYLKFSLF